MTNANVTRMLCNHYGWDHRDVEVEFLHSIGEEETYKATHYDGDKTVVKKVKLSITDFTEND
jgi:hypothetical protein